MDWDSVSSGLGFFFRREEAAAEEDRVKAAAGEDRIKLVTEEDRVKSTDGRGEAIVSSPDISSSSSGSETLLS